MFSQHNKKKIFGPNFRSTIMKENLMFEILIVERSTPGRKYVDAFRIIFLFSSIP